MSKKVEENFENLLGANLSVFCTLLEEKPKKVFLGKMQ